MSETTTKRAAAEFRAAAAAHGIERWRILDCSMCGYPCGYEFSGDRVFYDSSCDCVPYAGPPQPRTWEDVAEHYNMQSHPDVIAKYDAFWHLTTEPAHVG